MLAWAAGFALIAIEAIAIRYWTASRMYPFFFKEWTPFYYSLLLAADLGVAWLISNLYTPGGTPGMQLIFLLGAIFALVVLLGTLFLHWVVTLDMTDITTQKEKSKKK